MQHIPFDNQGDAISREAPADRVALFDLGTGTERSYGYGELRRATGAIAAGSWSAG